MKPRIYIASKTKHAAKWRQLRAEGVNIISTWIDEAGPGESKSLRDLAERCISEPASADILILYHEQGETVKASWIEAGVAVANSVTVIAVGLTEEHKSAFWHLPYWFSRPTIEAALEFINRGMPWEEAEQE